MDPYLVFLVSIALLFLLIIKFKLNAFVSLIIAAMVVGLLSPLVKLPEIMSEATGVFGKVCGGIGVVIALAAIIGHCLMESGAADKITRRFVGLLGEKRTSLSMLASACFRRSRSSTILLSRSCSSTRRMTSRVSSSV